MPSAFQALLSDQSLNPIRWFAAVNVASALDINISVLIEISLDCVYYFDNR